MCRCVLKEEEVAFVRKRQDNSVRVGYKEERKSVRLAQKENCYQRCFQAAVKIALKICNVIMFCSY